MGLEDNKEFSKTLKVAGGVGIASAVSSFLFNTFGSSLPKETLRGILASPGFFGAASVMLVSEIHALKYLKEVPQVGDCSDSDGILVGGMYLSGIGGVSGLVGSVVGYGASEALKYFAR